MKYLKDSHIWNLKRIIKNENNEFNDEEIKEAKRILKNNGIFDYGDNLMDYNNLFFRIEKREKQ